MIGTNYRTLLLVLLVYALVFPAVVLPVAVGLRGAEASYDEKRCYLPAIAQLRANFPAVDLVKDSLSASPPGYSQILAAVGLVAGDSLITYRIANAAMSLFGALALLCLVARLTGAGSLSAAAMLPMVCSGYYLKSAAQLTTDNPALILTFATLALALFADARPRNAVVAGVLACLSTYVRHISAWTAVPMGLKSLSLLASRKLGPALVWFLASLGVAVVVLVLFLAWGGLVPPRWAVSHQGLSLTAAVYSLSLAGVFGVIFLYAADGLRIGKSEWVAVAIGGVAGLLIFFFAETSPSYDAGRWGGTLWAVASKLPVTGDRSFVFLPLAAAGGAALALAGARLLALSPEKALFWGASLAAWMATGLFNRQIWHRYYESPILGFWGIWLLLVCISRGESQTTRSKVVLYGLSILLFAMGAYSMLFSATGFTAPLIGAVADR